MRTSFNDIVRTASQSRFRKRLLWIAGLCLPILIVLMGWLLIQQVADVNRIRNTMLQSLERRGQIMAIISAHHDLETGQRGYLITGRPEFLEPYAAGKEELRRAFPALRESLASEAGPLRHLQAMEELSMLRHRFAARTIELRRNGEIEAASALVANGRGKQLMDAIRAESAALLRFENEQLEMVRSGSERAILSLRIVTFGSLGLLLLLLGIAVLAIKGTLEARRRAMLALADVSSRRAAILEGAMDGILSLTPDGRIEAANRAALRMFDYKEEELLGQDVGILFADRPEPGAIAQALQEMGLEEDAGALTEIIGCRKDCSEFPTGVAVSAAQLAEEPRYVAIIRDISERKRIELLQKEFVSTVSHELRTPLTSVAGSLGLLAGGAAGEINDKAMRLITIARTNIDRLVRLVNDILDIEKLDAERMEFHNRPLELAPAVRQSIEETRAYAQSFRVTVELNPGPYAAFVHADGDRLAQVFNNLLSNAIKFSPRGGQVYVDIAPGRYRHRVTVRDTGPGIPKEFRSRIFDKFAQADASDARSKSGSGLGLNIARDIVKRLDGTISFDSHEGEGAQFHVYLPALPQEDDDELSDTLRR